MPAQLVQPVHRQAHAQPPGGGADAECHQAGDGRGECRNGREPVLLGNYAASDAASAPNRARPAMGVIRASGRASNNLTRDALNSASVKDLVFCLIREFRYKNGSLDSMWKAGDGSGREWLW